MCDEGESDSEGMWSSLCVNLNCIPIILMKSSPWVFLYLELLFCGCWQVCPGPVCWSNGSYSHTLVSKTPTWHLALYFIFLKELISFCAETPNGTNKRYSSKEKRFFWVQSQFTGVTYCCNYAKISLTKTWFLFTFRVTPSLLTSGQ